MRVFFLVALTYLSMIYPEQNLISSSKSNKNLNVNTMNENITYWSNFSDEVYILTLKIKKTGNVHLLKLSNVSQPKNPVGIFTFNIPESDTDKLWSMVNSDEFKSLKNPSEIQPGEIIRKITYVNSINKKQEIVKYTAEYTPAENLFLKIENELHNLITLVSAHPVIALHINLKSIEEINKDSKKIKASVLIKNLGSDTLEIPNPKLWKELNNILEIVFTRNDLKLTEMRDSHRIIKTFNITNLLETSPKNSETSQIKIKPGQNYIITFLVDKPQASGSYDIGLSFEVNITDLDNNSLKYLIISPNMNITIDCNKHNIINTQRSR